ncbi:MAG: SDR family oxidoreductase [Candidatus Kapabacteria bacterium]|nr:SDR family oxidoreductase [Candidatus Kapabacteria bacterium]
MTTLQSIVIIGATSAIAQQTAREFARRGAAIMLCARSQEKLDAVAQDLRAYGASRVLTGIFDASDIKSHHGLIEKYASELGGIDAVLIAYGTLPDNDSCYLQPDIAQQEFTLNATSIIGLSAQAANYFEKRGGGVIAVISSVAGERGRQSNFLYGAAKGAVSLYTQGLRNRLSSKNIAVVTIKPGFVDTPMTAHVQKNPLFASAQSVGKAIADAMIARKDVVYVPGFWRFIMAVVRAIPESIFKKMSM